MGNLTIRIWNIYEEKYKSFDKTASGYSRQIPGTQMELFIHKIELTIDNASCCKRSR